MNNWNFNLCICLNRYADQILSCLLTRSIHSFIHTLSILMPWHVLIISILYIFFFILIFFRVWFGQARAALYQCTNSWHLRNTKLFYFMDKLKSIKIFLSCEWARIFNFILFLVFDKNKEPEIEILVIVSDAKWDTYAAVISTRSRYYWIIKFNELKYFSACMRQRTSSLWVRRKK